MLDLNNYFDQFGKLINSNCAKPKIYETAEKLRSSSNNNAPPMLALGNGASNAIASHFALDLTKQARIPTNVISDPAILTAAVNDFGAEDMFKGWVNASYPSPPPLTFIFSVSGESKNVINAAKAIKQKNGEIITFTGRQVDNSLTSYADVSFWVDSHSYNIVEAVSMFWATAIVDTVIGTAEYETSSIKT